MNTKRLALISLLAGLLGHSLTSRADDIDIYSGSTTGNTPNVLFVLDNAANFSSSASGFSTCPITNPTTGAVTNTSLSLAGTVGGIEQCALYNVINTLKVNTDGTATVNIGMMVYNANNIRDINNLNCGASSSTGGCLAQPLVAMTAANKTSVLNWITTWTTTGGAGSGYIKASGEATAATMQEAWAYFAGKTGLSTRNYSTIQPTAGCQKNFVIFIGNSYSAAGTPGDAPSSAATALSCATSTAAYCAGATTTQQALILNSVTTSCGSYTFPSSAHETKGFYADEWARFMSQADIYSTPTGTQNITTYTVGILGSACQAEYSGLLTNMAAYGGGKYFPTTDYSSLVVAILKILNEVQAVNSVFSSSSLPVSVNAQGTFLNQIYMGMFRPDAAALPRWAGNLKQYQLIFDPTTKTLSLGDSLGISVINPVTGFLSPDAISFWSCTDLTTSPYPNSYLSKLTSTQIALLTTNKQNCTDPLSSGFWVNDSSSATAVAQGFDLADGERVERGGAAQRIRNLNLTNNYATSPAAPRKLYTWCPSGSSCVSDLTNAANAFATTNSGITAPTFGASSSLNVSSIVRTGTTALVTTVGTHGYVTGSSVTISGAAQTEYNVTQNITTPASATTFTITGLPDKPTTPTAGAYTASLHNSAAQTVSTITRSSSSTATATNSVTATATTAVAHGYSTSDSVQITGASPTDYNGVKTIATSGPTSTQFTYSVPVYPTTPAVNTYKAVIHPYTRTLSSITKSGSTATATTTATHGFHVGQIVTIAGTGQTAYNGNRTIASVPTTSTFTFSATGSVSAITAGASVTPSTTAVVLTGLTRTGTTIAATANATGATASAFTNGDTLDITVNTGTTLNEGAYIVSGAVISCSGTCTTFTYPITVTPAVSATGAMQAALSGTQVAISAGSITRIGTPPTTARVAATAHGFADGVSVDISTSGTVYARESAYTGTWTITLVDANTFTYGPVTLSPATPATAISGTPITVYQGGTPPSKDPLVNWVRGEDNFGDEFGPGGTATIRPSVHGDVLHSRPTVINYGSYSVAITATADSGTTRTATASVADVTTIGTFGATPIVTFANGQACSVTVTSSTTFTYQNTRCGAAGAQAASVGSKVVVFYGDNGGVFHAVNGSQTGTFNSTGPGGEMWGFIPKEFFGKLNRLRTNSPQLNLPSTPPGILPAPASKDYFIDGATGLYQVIDGTGATTKAVLYLSMRRGGNFIYAIDVTTPATPSVLWQVDDTSTGMSELGQTWSQPKVARVAGYSNPVLIFGAGYDTNEDSEPITTADASGRGIFILDALTGALVWSATPSAGATSCTAGPPATCVVSGMNYSIPSDITLVDRNQDGYIDRLYAADTGGNIWRVDLEKTISTTTYNTPDYWNVHRLAALGCFGGACAIPSSTTQRKFFFPPEVITATAAHAYDSVIAGSGDREHPLYVSTSTQRYNRVYLLMDPYTGNDASAMTTPITMSGTLSLFDATSTPWDGTLNGYYVTLAAGEKVVNAPLVTAGFVNFGTNQPAAPSTTSCTSNLGTAKGYQLSPFTGATTSTVFVGGGLPPSAVSGVVNIVVNGVVEQVPFLIGGGGNPACVGPDCSSGLGAKKPPITVSTKRSRTYWYIKDK